MRYKEKEKDKLNFFNLEKDRKIVKEKERVIERKKERKKNNILPLELCRACLKPACTNIPEMETKAGSLGEDFIGIYCVLLLKNSMVTFILDYNS